MTWAELDLPELTDEEKAEIRKHEREIILDAIRSCQSSIAKTKHDWAKQKYTASVGNVSWRPRPALEWLEWTEDAMKWHQDNLKRLDDIEAGLISAGEPKLEGKLFV